MKTFEAFVLNSNNEPKGTISVNASTKSTALNRAIKKAKETFDTCSGGIMLYIVSNNGNKTHVGTYCFG